jgi:endonuclease III
MISSIGFYKTKAKNIFKTSQMLVENNLENFESIEELTTLP